MTAENKKVVKILAISVGVILILTGITILIVKQVQKNRDAREALKASADSKGTDSPPAKTSSGTSGSTSGSSSTNTFGGRTFSKTEIERMQAYLLSSGAIERNELIVSSIRDTGGIDGKIGTGFKTAYNEAIRIGLIKSLDDLYTQAMKH